MTAPARSILSAFEPSRINDGADAMQKSWDKVFDAHRYRAQFPAQWAGFLCANFRSAEEVAVTFDVTYQCARNWMEGTHRPSGDKVALAAISMPRRFAAHMGIAA